MLKFWGRFESIKPKSYVSILSNCLVTGLSFFTIAIAIVASQNTEVPTKIPRNIGISNISMAVASSAMLLAYSVA